MREVIQSPSPEEEKWRIRDITAYSETQVGDIFHLFTRRWWQGWLEYGNQTPLEGERNSLDSLNAVKRPSSIDNSDLIYEAASLDSTSEIELHDTLVEGQNYILLPEAVRNQLHAWYGGGPTLARNVIVTASLKQSWLSRFTHRKIFELKSKQVQIWDYDIHQKHALDEMEKTLGDAIIQMVYVILVEVSISNNNGGLISWQRIS